MTATKTGKEAAPVDGGASDNGPLPAKADYETAMEASGFGLFNILLLLVAFPPAIAIMLSTSSMSFVYPSAECDLKLTLLDKGILNAITYAGMITSALLWGFLADTKGRKKLIIFGFVANFICVVGSALSQSVLQLIIFKYVDGLVGPVAVFMTYLTELHGKSYRQRVMMLIGLMFSAGTLLLPVMGIAILPQQWEIRVIGLTLHSWQIFLLISAIPSLLGFTFLTFFPESPKFLMSQGRNEEALEVFKKIYALNKHKPKDTYPIKELVNELEKEQTDAAPKKNDDLDKTTQIENGKDQHPATPIKVNQFSAGVKQMLPLFRKPYLHLSLLAYMLSFCTLLGQNTLRLWIPQLFASITDYEQLTSIQSIDAAETSLICTILDYSRSRTLQMTNDTNELCEVNITPATYTNNVIVAGSSIVGFTMAGFLVNLIGVNSILMLSTFTAGLCGVLMYWSNSALMTIIISSISVTMGSIADTSITTATVGSFPTSLRTMVVSLQMMVGRIGSVLGNMIFPALVSLGCAPPFLLISCFMFVACVGSAFLPIKNKSDLK